MASVPSDVEHSTRRGGGLYTTPPVVVVDDDDAIEFKGDECHWGSCAPVLGHRPPRYIHPYLVIYKYFPIAYIHSAPE